MVKQIKKLNKLSKSKKQQSNLRTKSKSKTKSRSKSMKGGDGSGGRVALPPAYYGNGLDGYYAPGSKELFDDKQLAVSQGSIWSSGNMAGPNLFPMKGGDCGCRKQKKNKSKKNILSKRKNMKNKKTNKK